jgi:subtilisin-like proprotein convertase family protein
MNTSAAADLITNSGFTNILEENTLNESDTYSFTVEAIDPNTPLVATIAWTDPAGPNQSLTLADDPTPRLVNDLDLKIIAPDGFTAFLPWTLSPLTPDAPALKTDNVVDNVEKVEVENAVGQYIIEVSHKGSLQDLLQNYTLVVSGIAESEFALTTDEAFKSFCSNSVATFDIDVNSIASFSETVSLSKSGLPSTFNVSFSASTIAGEGSSVISIDNLASQPVGDYPFTITASTATESFDFQFSLNAREVVPLSDINILSPAPGSTELTGLSPIVEWESNPDALSYEFEVSTTANFDDIILSESTELNEISIPELNENQTYYFRVRPSNDCFVGNFTAASFTTKSLMCEPILIATDTPVIIENDITSVVQSQISVAGLFTVYPIEDINVSLDITHTWLSDLVITLTSPSGTEMTLLDQVCGSSDDLSVVFDDKGSAQNCSNSIPTLSGINVPEDKLSVFNGESPDGIWTLTVEDVFGEDGGTIDNFGIEFCYEETLSVASNEIAGFSIYPNPSNGRVDLNFGQPAVKNSEIKVFDLNGRVLETFNIQEGNIRETIELNNLQSGIYLIQLNALNSSATKKLIIK